MEILKRIQLFVIRIILLFNVLKNNLINWAQLLIIFIYI